MGDEGELCSHNGALKYSIATAFGMDMANQQSPRQTNLLFILSDNSAPQQLPPDDASHEGDASFLSTFVNKVFHRGAASTPTTASFSVGGGNFYDHEGGFEENQGPLPEYAGVSATLDSRARDNE